MHKTRYSTGENRILRFRKRGPDTRPESKEQAEQIPADDIRNSEAFKWASPDAQARALRIQEHTRKLSGPEDRINPESRFAKWRERLQDRLSKLDKRYNEVTDLAKQKISALPDGDPLRSQLEEWMTNEHNRLTDFVKKKTAVVPGHPEWKEIPEGTSAEEKISILHNASVAYAVEWNDKADTITRYLDNFTEIVAGGELDQRIASREKQLKRGTEDTLDKQYARVKEKEAITDNELKKAQGVLEDPMAGKENQRNALSRTILAATRERHDLERTQKAFDGELSERGKENIASRIARLVSIEEFGTEHLNELA